MVLWLVFWPEPLLAQSSQPAAGMLGHRRLGPKIADSKSQIADSKSGPKEQVTLKDCSLHLLERKKPEYQRNRTRLLKRRDHALRTSYGRNGGTCQGCALSTKLSKVRFIEWQNEDYTDGAGIADDREGN
jgi:hypothetical protein